MKLTSVFRTNQFKRDAKALFKKHYDAAKLAGAIEALMRPETKWQFGNESAAYSLLNAYEPPPH